MVKKHLVIQGETTNMHRKSIKHKTSAPVSDWKKYDMRGLVAESKMVSSKCLFPRSEKFRKAVYLQEDSVFHLFWVVCLRELLVLLE